jgi:glycogen operon protein
MDWNLDKPRERLREFTGEIIRLRLKHPNLHRRKFFQDREVRKRSDGSLVRIDKDASWFNPDGNEVSDEAWNAGWSRAIALLLNGRTLQVSDEDGNWIVDDSFLLLVNAADQGVEFTLPASPSGRPWQQIVDTENLDDPFAIAAMNGSVIVGGRALKLLSDGA